MGFPMAVAIGLGTALQFPQLAGLIEAPDRLQYPRQQLCLSRLAKTPRSEWHSLRDKLQILPCELTELLDTAGSVPGGKLHALVVPEISKVSQKAVVQSIDRPFALETLGENVIGRANDRGYPPWLEINFRKRKMSRKDLPMKKLSQVSAVRISFGLSLDHFEDNRNFVDRLLDALK